MSEVFEPRPWQTEGKNHVVKHQKVLIPLPGGTGKSFIPLLASQEVGLQSITILCSANALYTWVKNIRLHRPDLANNMIVLEKMPIATRTQFYNNPNYRVVIATARSFWRNWPFITTVPGMLILDEPQKYMRKATTKTCMAIAEYANYIPYVVPLTGSPESRGRQDLWPILNLLRPKKYPSKWKFMNNWLYMVRGPFGMTVEGPKNTPGFNVLTAPEIYRPSMPITGMPKVVRDTIPIEMEPAQAELYHTYNAEMVAWLSNGDLLLSSNHLSKILRLRQILCCPKILDPGIDSYGAGIEMAIDHIAESPETRSHAVFFSIFVDAIPHFQQRLFNEGYDKQVVFKAGMTSDEMKAAEDYFRANKDCIAIVSIMFAQSFELEGADIGYMLGYSFDPEDNKQAEWRIARLTSNTDFKEVKYMHHLGTYDDRQLSILSTKTLNTRVDMNSMHHIRELIIGNKNQNDTQ